MSYKYESRFEQLTVSKLIEELKKMPQHLPVIHEGCDCSGSARSVELSENNDYVEITRFDDEK